MWTCVPCVVCIMHHVYVCACVCMFVIWVYVLHMRIPMCVMCGSYASACYVPCVLCTHMYLAYVHICLLRSIKCFKIRTLLNSGEWTENQGDTCYIHRLQPRNPVCLSGSVPSTMCMVDFSELWLSFGMEWLPQERAHKTGSCPPFPLPRGESHTTHQPEPSWSLEEVEAHSSEF